ncbi:MAG TPA: hypothetical protein VFN68_00270 [Acidimicrobiales bacterium]|nr:hypothetical protein [Acidimicrobiales bacterium]
MLLTAMMAVTFGLVALRAAPSGAAAPLPEMCNGRSDPSLQVVAQAGGQGAAAPGYFLGVSTDAAGAPAGTMIVSVGSQRLVVANWCRVWQHLPGQPSNGNCGMTYPAGAITAHAVGETRFDGQDVLVRTDVRELAGGQMLFRVRYRPLAAAESAQADDCETGWAKIPPEGWDPLAVMRVQGNTGPAGYRLAGADGGVFTFGAAPFYGSLGGHALNRPIVGMATDPATGGYWLVASDGGVFTFGAAPFYGSLGGKALNKPIVGMATDPATGGYWLVASDGGVFSFDAPFYGSMGGRLLDAPVVGMAVTPTGGGYRLVTSDGGVFTFGDAPFQGSLDGRVLAAPVVGMAVTPTGGGYRLAAADGGVFTFGDAPFYGSAAGLKLNNPVVGMASNW